MLREAQPTLFAVCMVRLNKKAENVPSEIVQQTFQWLLNSLSARAAFLDVFSFYEK